jgi:hypothetical protein
MLRIRLQTSFPIAETKGAADGLESGVRVQKLKSRIRIALPTAYPLKDILIWLLNQATAQSP